MQSTRFDSVEDMTMTFRGTMRTGLATAGLLWFLAGAGPAGAYTYMESLYGTPLVGLSARGMAMGGVCQ